MLRFFSLCSLLILVGCGKNYNPNLNRPHVNTSLEAYVNRFVQVAESLGRPVALGRIQVEFVETMEGNVIGKCYPGLMTPRIEINRSYWERPGVSNARRESLMFHELGHCILGRGHDDSLISGYGLDKSIMNSIALPSGHYENNWNYYMDELFGIPTYFTLSAVSQFPAQYYNNSNLTSHSSLIASENIVEQGQIVYSTSEDEITGSFSCGE